MSVLFCDTNCEIWYTEAKELGLDHVIRMPYTLDGKEYYYDLGEHTDFRFFYDRLRARADALILHEEPSAPPLLIDFKTGRKWDTDAFQLRVETLLVHLLYDKPVIGYSYWYVDTGETVSDFVDFGSRGLDGVSDVVALMHEMQNAIKNNFFPAKRNKFCKWCDFYRTPLCTL